MRGCLLLIFLLSALACQGPAPSTAGLPELLAPIALGQSVQVSQHLRFSHAGKVENLWVAWSQQAGRLQLVGLSAQGQTLFEISFDGDRFSEDVRIPLPSAFSSRRLLQELQWAYWPAAVIEQSMQGSAWHMEQTTQERTVYGPGQQITYQFLDETSLGSLSLQHNQGYQLDIETLSIKQLNADPVNGPSVSEEVM